jgi:hypothetical protein
MLKVRRAMEMERGRVRLATPYREVESQLSSSLERTIRSELAQASHSATKEQRKGADRPSLQTPLASPP